MRLARFTRLCLLGPLAVLAMFGCASVGQSFDTTHVNDIQKGAHDKAQIVQWFGQAPKVEPLASHPAGCVERWTYTYAHSVAGGSTESQTLVVDFDGTGKVCDSAYVKQ